MTEKVARDPEQEKPARTITRSYEGGGVVSTCSCRWLRYAETIQQAAQQEADHRCRQTRQKAHHEAPGRRTASWDERTEETWLDRM